MNSLILRKNSKRKAYSVIRSFFVHNRCGLSADPGFHIRGVKPPVQAKLSPNEIYEILLGAELRYRSMLLFNWQSFQDDARLIHISSHSAGQLVDRIKSGLDPVRVDLPGRKRNENDAAGGYCCFIGADAVTMLRECFENERGWPKPGEPVWLNENRKPVTKAKLTLPTRG